MLGWGVPGDVDVFRQASEASDCDQRLVCSSLIACLVLFQLS